jgi:nucleoside-diphosphate-sugar epimerase
MRILITGGAGYKGIKLAQTLLDDGYEITILDNFMYGQECCLFLFQYPKVNFIKKDIRNIAAADIASYDVIFHLAGISGYPACEANPHSAQMINVAASIKLVNLLQPEQLLIYASTTSIYGRATEVCTEESEVHPVSLYARTKYEAEKICMSRENSIALRFATLFGVAPRMRRDLLVNDFTMRAVQERSLVLFDSSSVRTFLHVDDAIRCYHMTLQKTNEMIGQVFNVGSDTLNYSKLQIAEKIKEQVPVEIIDSSLVDPDLRSFIIKFKKIETLSFHPTISLEEGIEELVRLYQFYEPNRPYQII